ncbi:transposase, partial [Clostridium sp. HCP1S3_B4]
ETKVKKGKEITTTFEWITSIEITEKNAVKLAGAGRKRWKIENQGFNRQKKWQGNIEHACSHNANAQKCHYLMEQIADFIKQLYEYFFLNKNEIKKKQKNISSDLLA